MAKTLDYRSDACSKPSDEMRAAMASAEVGDDVFGEDPTVIELQKMAAELLGKEAALYVPSGTMGNLICVLNHCWGRGAEVILGDKSHIHVYEQGGIAQLGGVHPRVLPNNPDGTFDIAKLRDLVRADDAHFPITTLVCVENTHMAMGGKVLPLEWLEQLGACCREFKLPLHMDGARMLNAAVSLGVPPSRVVRDCDTVSLCLSKGVGAPIGSVLVGKKEFIQRAVRLRKVLGGGMRQAGIVAAAGVVGLRRYLGTIETDHRNARAMATAVASLNSSQVSVDEKAVQTNIVMLNCHGVTATDLVNKLKQTSSSDNYSVLSIAINPKQVRLTLSWNVSEENNKYGVAKVVSVIKSL